MQFRNVTPKSIILYQSNGVKHVIPTGGKVDGSKFPEVASSYDFEPVEDIPEEVEIPVPKEAVPTIEAEIGNLRGQFLAFQTEITSLVREQADIILSLKSQIEAITEAQKEPIHTQREPKKKK